MMLLPRWRKARREAEKEKRKERVWRLLLS